MIPEEWIIMPFGKGIKFLTDYEANGSYAKLDEFAKVGIGKPYAWFVRSVDLEKNRIGLVNGNKYVNKDSYNFLKKTQLFGNELLIMKVGSIGNVYLLPKISEPATLGNNLYLIFTNELLDSKFAYYWLKSALGIASLFRIASSTTLPSINKENTKSSLFFYPSIKEQQKIVSILSNVDELISSYDKTIQTTKKLKKGLMQTLLTRGMGHKKFKKVKWLFGKDIEIPEEWKITVIGNEFVIGPGGTPKTSNSKFFKGNVNWVTTSDLNRGIINTSTALITEEAVRETHLKIYPKGSFVIAAIGVDASHTRGNCGILSFDAAINQVCLVFKKSESVLTEFFYYYYLQFANNLIFKYSQGTKQWAFYPYVIKKIPFVLPSLEEQQKIASILSSVDDKISKLESKKKSAESLKKGLMQKLLTGQMRVTV